MQNLLKMPRSGGESKCRLQGRTMWAKISLKYSLTADPNLLNWDLNSSLFNPFQQFSNYFMNYRRPPF